MSFDINTNIASLQAQQYLNINNSFQNKTINEVTSGVRIVNAGDDAAGLAVANGYRSNEAVITQGIQNANQGLSQLQIADGGISNISQLLDRARTLATESASGTFTGSRDVLNSEFQSVIGEINRQAQTIGLQSGRIVLRRALAVFIGGGQARRQYHGGRERIGVGEPEPIDRRRADLGLQGVQAIEHARLEHRHRNGVAGDRVADIPSRPARPTSPPRATAGSRRLSSRARASVTIIR